MKVFALPQRMFFSALLFFLILAVVQALDNGGGATTEPRQPCPRQAQKDNVRKKWPELVGLPAEKAAEKIRADLPWVRIVIVPPRAFVTMDYNHCRVRIFVDDARIVIQAPMVG
ncbi:subtilisin inhibitor-like [Aristolochia californica]|uniref:subtilisin inhibitor-like n=1 Tax=Aristolochia californica TaxID=171875 RepID=UPI0035D651EB